MSVLLLLKYGSAGVIGVAIAIFSYVLGITPSKVASRLGVRGLKRQRVLAEGGLWASVEPFVRWLGVRVSRFVTDENREKLDKEIGLAGDFLGLTADELIALCVVSAFGCTIFGAIAGYVSGLGAIATILLGLAGASLPYMRVTATGQERLVAISRGLPYVIDLMALAMGAGLDFPAAVAQVVEKSSNPNDPLVEEFVLILQTLRIGRTRIDALTEFARRAPCETVKEFAAAVVQAEERGNPVAGVLAIQAGVSRTRRSQRAEEAAAQAGVKLVGPLSLVFLCILIMVLAPPFVSLGKGF